MWGVLVMEELGFDIELNECNKFEEIKNKKEKNNGVSGSIWMSLRKSFVIQLNKEWQEMR